MENRERDARGWGGGVEGGRETGMEYLKSGEMEREWREDEEIECK